MITGSARPTYSSQKKPITPVTSITQSFSAPNPLGFTHVPLPCALIMQPGQDNFAGPGYSRYFIFA